MWDEARVEVVPVILGDMGRAKAPVMPVLPESYVTVDGNKVFIYRNI